VSAKAGATIKEIHAEPNHSDEEKRTLILTGRSRASAMPGEAFLQRRLAGDHLFASCLSGELSLGGGAGGSYPGGSGDPADTGARWRRCVRALMMGRGKLHALVNNAASRPRPGGERLGTLEFSQDLWRQVFESICFPPSGWPRPEEQLAKAHGAIVNVTSIAGSRVHPFAGAAYAISKAAAAALTREMAADSGPGDAGQRHRPGEIDTAICHPATEKIVGPFRCAGWAARRSRKSDIYLCTDQSSYVTVRN